MDKPLGLRAYLAATRLVPLVAPAVLRRRLRKGKEDPARWTEKLGRPSARRPKGPLIWINAVGLGEVLSLRGLAAHLAHDAHVLVTSTTVQSAAALATNMPDNTTHQFLPLDAPGYRRAFLNHWQPDLTIWAEQDLWPGFVNDLHQRSVPQAMVAARMNAVAFARHSRARRTFAALYARMALITAQEAETRDHLTRLGATDVQVTGSLKPGAPALACDEAALGALREELAGRFVWVVAPAHQADVDVALPAHAALRVHKPDALLIVAPRFPARALALPPDSAYRSLGQTPGPDTSIWVCDTLGEMGLVYRLAQVALIGGTFDQTQGHNPWEAVRLGLAILHGPQVGNFRPDFAELDAAGAALPIRDGKAVAEALQKELSGQADAARRLIETHDAALAALAQTLVSLMRARS